MDSQILLAMLPPQSRQVEFALRDFGIGSMGAKDLAAVRTALKAQPRPKLVMTQISLGDGNWRDVMGEVSRVDSTIPVILYTQTAATELWMDALDSGVYDLVPADCGPAQLLGVVARALERNGRSI